MSPCCASGIMLSYANPKRTPIRTDGRMENPRGVTKVPGGRVERTLYKDIIPDPCPDVKKGRLPSEGISHSFLRASLDAAVSLDRGVQLSLPLRSAHRARQTRSEASLSAG